MQTATTNAPPDGFRALAVQVRNAGLLDRRPGYYGSTIILTIVSLAIGWTTFIIVGNSWATLGVAVFLGLVFTQLAFIGHDAGHQQVFRSHKANWLLGLVLTDGLIGLSFGWWVPKHSAHHAHPNQIGRDTDIGDGVIVFNSTDGIGGENGAVARFLERWQAWLFFPLMLLRTVGLHVSGVQRLLRLRDRAAAREGLLLLLNAALYFGALVWILSPMKALAFVAIQQGVFSVYLGLSFAPNHKGMPIIDSGVEMNFARHQVITARNIAGGRFVDFVFGGLNYQTEHHLFPTMPRPNLARAQDLVRAFCIESDLGYCEETLTSAYSHIIRQLNARGVATARRPRRVISEQQVPTL